MMSRTRSALRIWGDFEKVSWVELSPASGEDGWLSLAGDVLGGADEKARIESMCISLYVEEPLNSKVIKSFVPELRSRKCFSCFEIPIFYVYMSYEHSLSISHISGYLAMLQNLKYWTEAQHFESCLRVCVWIGFLAYQQL